MSRLPVAGSDSGSWGDILNDFLSVAHSSGGTLKSNSVSDTQVSSLSQSKISGLSAALLAKADVSDVVQKGTIVFNVKDYGAAGDGTTDDTAAIQSAVDAAVTSGGVVFVPPGTFKISDVITIASPGKVGIVGAGMQASIISQSSTSKQALYGADITDGLTVRDLRLTSSATGDVLGLYDAILLEQTGVTATQNIVIENVYIDHWSRHGINLADPIASVFTNVRVQSVAGYGFYVNLGTSLLFSACYANDCATGGYSLTATAYAQLTACAADACPTAYTLTNCNNLSLASCGCEGISGNGFVISGGNSVVLTSCYSSGNAAVAFYATNNATGVVLVGVQERFPSGATASIKTDSGTSATVIQSTTSTATAFAVGTTQEIAKGVLDIATSGTAINSISRGATTNFAAYVLRTAGIDRWALQMTNDSTNDFKITDSAQGNTVMLAESRASQANVSLLAGTKSYGGGVGVLYVGNATTVPTTNPTGGGILYVESGALKFRGSSGTVTTIGNA